MTGDRIDAEEACRLGIINRIFPHDTLQEEVRNFAKRLADGPAETLAQIKRGVYLGATGTLTETLAHEEQAQSSVFLSDDAKEGMLLGKPVESYVKIFDADWEKYYDSLVSKEAYTDILLKTVGKK